MTHSDTNPRSSQYLTHAHSHITQAVVATDSCFGLVRPHQHALGTGQTVGWCSSALFALCCCFFFSVLFILCMQIILHYKNKHIFLTKIGVLHFLLHPRFSERNIILFISTQVFPSSSPPHPHPAPKQN